MMVFIGNGKTTCFGLQRPSSGFDNLLPKGVLYDRPSIQNSFSKKVVKHEDGRYMPKHAVCPLLINTIVQPYRIVVFLTEHTSPYSTNIALDEVVCGTQPTLCVPIVVWIFTQVLFQEKRITHHSNVVSFIQRNVWIF